MIKRNLINRMKYLAMRSDLEGTRDDQGDITRATQTESDS